MLTSHYGAAGVPLFTGTADSTVLFRPDPAQLSERATAHFLSVIYAVICSSNNASQSTGVPFIMK